MRMFDKTAYVSVRQAVSTTRKSRRAEASVF